MEIMSGLFRSKIKKSLMCVSNIEVHISRKAIKNMRLVVAAPDGIVKLSAPMASSDQIISDFVNAQLDWIKKHQRYYLSLPKPVKLTYFSGEKHLFLGKYYPLQVIEQASGRQKIEIKGDFLRLTIHKGSSVAQREKLLTQWYRCEIKKIMPQLLVKWQLIIGKQVSDWRIKKMKTRWGSCNINKKRIWLNLELIKKSPECLEYVLIHEMVHLYERHHNARFYAFMDQFLPNWMLIEKQLYTQDTCQK